jgi:RHS repeat-associated protein
MHHYATGEAGHKYKNIRYQYDLISGKVNKVLYQQGKSDAYYHKYAYDAENKLTQVYTSRDEVYWEQEAAYSYYKHGPMARVELGKLAVQGIDYAYTLQGWLKGVNSTAILTSSGGYDMGGDGVGRTAKDVYSYSLNYFVGDYSAISTATPFAAISVTSTGLAALGDGLKTGRPLYNGNISSMLVNIPKLSTVPGGAGGGSSALLYGYAYDQLNRIVGMNAYSGINNATNSFNPVVMEAYKERVSYDANGNIKTYLRNGDVARLSMDNMTYDYKAGNNQLDKVVDAAADETTQYEKYKDIKQGQGNGNYIYDKIGNLISDISEGITNIEWTVYGKIAAITKSNGTSIQYNYDPSGNRISKTVIPSGGGAALTFYVRDASGNVMGVYEKAGTAALALTELHIYGSSRLGVYNIEPSSSLEVTMPYTHANNLLSVGNLVNFTRGNKFFELSNHLGNVLVTVSDKKIQIQNGATGNVGWYEADVVTATDYYPYGMNMPGRNYTASVTTKFRYGFNGKELDMEVVGTTTYDYGFRIYNPALGRFLSVDPLTKDYSFLTPYQFASNSPIGAIDLDGLEAIPINGPPYGFYREYQISLSTTYDSETYIKSPGGSQTLLLIEDAKGVKYWIIKQANLSFANGVIVPYSRFYYFDKSPSSEKGAYAGGKWIPYLIQDQINAAPDADGSTGLLITSSILAGVATIFVAPYAKAIVIDYITQAILGVDVPTPDDVLKKGGRKVGEKIIEERLENEVKEEVVEKIVEDELKKEIKEEVGDEITKNAAKTSTKLLGAAPANLTQKGLDHIIARHWFTSGAKGAGKFAQGTTGASLKEMIHTASTQGVFRANTADRAGTIAEYNFGRVIGTTSGGAPASNLRVVIGTNGNVITAFPY